MYSQVLLLVCFFVAVSLANVTIINSQVTSQTGSIVISGTSSDDLQVTSSSFTSTASNIDVNNWRSVTVDTSSTFHASTTLTFNTNIDTLAFSASTAQSDSNSGNPNIDLSPTTSGTFANGAINAVNGATRGNILLTRMAVSGTTAISGDTLTATTSSFIGSSAASPITVNVRQWNAQTNYISFVHMTQDPTGVANGNGIVFTSPGPTIPGLSAPDNSRNSVKDSVFDFSTAAITRFEADLSTYALPGRLTLNWPGYLVVVLDVVVTQELFNNGIATIFSRNTIYFGRYGNSNNNNYAQFYMNPSQLGNCLQIDRQDGNTIYVTTSYSGGGLSFLPVNTNGYYYNQDTQARFCRATSVLKVKQSPTIINGVSFKKQVPFILTHTFTLPYPGEDTTGAHRVSRYDFQANGLVTVKQLSVTDTPTTRTVVYEVTVEPFCDGLVYLFYTGTVDGNGNDQYRRGFDTVTSNAVYAGCLASQFCL